MTQLRVVHYYRDALRASGVTDALFSLQHLAASAGVETLTVHAPASGNDVTPSIARGLPHREVLHLGRGRQFSVPAKLPLDPERDILVLHEGWMNANYAAAAQASRLHIPYVVVPHGVYEPGIMMGLHLRSLRRTAFERNYLENAALVHFFLPDEPLLLAGICPIARSVVIPPPLSVTASIDSPSLRVQAAAPARDPYIAWFGRYAPYHKGLDRLLNAVALIPKSQRPPLHLRGVPYKRGVAWVQTAISRLGLEDCVSVGGPLVGADEKLGFLAGACCFAFPSRWESFGIALFEALSSGVPVIASNNIQMANLLDCAHAAIVTDFDDPMSAAQALLAGSFDDRRGAESPGRAFVTAHFEATSIQTKYLEMLDYVRMRANA